MRYKGGKSKVAGHFVGLIDEALAENGGRYVEPFVGGMNVAWRLENLVSARMSDADEDLIILYNAMLSGFIPPNTVTKEEYCALRAAKAKGPMSSFLSFGCAYGGQKWAGYARGGGRNHVDENARFLAKKFAGDVSPYEFAHDDYQSIPQQDLSSVYYCDPPYRGTSGYGAAIDHDEFYEWCEGLVRLGHTVFVSEFSAPDKWEVAWSKDRKMKVGPKSVSTVTEKLYKVRA